MSLILKSKYFKNWKKWRTWLSKNHSSEKEIWVIYYKKHTKKPTISYHEAVEHALCYGWIDSTVKRLDDERYRQKFTPRNKKSVWSDLNRKRVEKLILEKKMTKFGLEKINAAKDNGMWYKKYKVYKVNTIPTEFKSELKLNKLAKNNFDKMPKSQKNHFINWISAAKKEETRIRRSKKAIKLLKKNLKLGMI